MDISPYGIAKTTFIHIPNILRTGLLALLGLSPNTSVQDALTETICVAVRPVMGTPHSLLASQKQWNTDLGIWGRMWISKVTIPRTSDYFHMPGGKNAVFGVREALAKAIQELGDGSETYEMPEIVDVEAEWTGYRAGVWHSAPRPKISEREHYEKMMEEVQPASPTLLYIHGGAFVLMDPSTHRWTTSALAKSTSGRCLSVRYRLSPQVAFPAALLDVLTAYLYLICPPPGSFHTAVPGSEIVIAGDSSGAGLAAALLLLLITLPRIGITRLRCNNRNGTSEVTIPTPPAAGLALTSAWLDVSRSLPSVTLNSRFDIIAPPTKASMTPNFPRDSIWPVKPARVETYCEATMVSHPLVSPLAARPDSWKGAPPVYVCVGWEGMQDEAEVFSRRVAQSGTSVVFEGFVGMPHCFALVPWCRSGRRAFQGWAEFCKGVVGSLVEVKRYACWIDKFGEVTRIKLESLGMESDCLRGNVRNPLDDALVDDLMRKSREWRLREETNMRRIQMFQHWL